MDPNRVDRITKRFAARRHARRRALAAAAGRHPASVEPADQWSFPATPDCEGVSSTPRGKRVGTT
jgi:hypothetical protein